MKLRDMLTGLYPEVDLDDGDLDAVIKVFIEWLGDRRSTYDRKGGHGDTVALMINGLRSNTL